ncbi:MULTISPECIES: hypothetical protein [unclassified Microbacterium]|uniref:hypothetical protein n=1 Tax=unclassified Microbacterium TaxID=2609290 RepID=UPI000445762F|nr:MULTISPECIES: hypothetical protein [unclassified Microbacterium]EXJ51960.1 hypothetical protein AS96_06975 [Microbacterium sp. MRS-1]ODT23496.1 MAG: hypothetical protein ABS64_09390 [Microbacterium sp. SCN 69-37]
MTEPTSSPQSNKILRATIWVAIGALIAAALVCVVWVLIGDSNGIVGKAFLTILLLAGFAGVSIAESNMAQNRPTWLALTSMISWVLILLVGAFLIWMPTSGYFGAGAERVFKFIVIALIIQGALLHARLFLKAFQRHQTTFTSIVTYVTIGLVVILMVMLVLPLMTDEFVTYRPLYWRVVVALAILSAVGTALLPLVNALFAPKRPRPHLAAPYGAAPYGSAPLPVAAPAAPAQPPAPAPAPAPAASAPWPTFADGVTPLPVFPDGSPDWNAYYTGQPSPGARFWFTEGASAPTAPAAQGHDGYPPAPPLPPQQHS